MVSIRLHGCEWLALVIKLAQCLRVVGNGRISHKLDFSFEWWMVRKAMIAFMTIFRDQSTP